MSNSSQSKNRPKTIEHYRNVVYLYCDGACKGNPGPGGCGIVLLYNDHRKNLGLYLGPETTNNIAELEALRHGLSVIKNKESRIIVCTDSTYVIGLMSKGWKPKANLELVEEIKEYLKEFPNLSFLQVPGHSFVPANEDADRLASFVAKEQKEPGVLREMEVPKNEKINKQHKNPEKPKRYHDPYYNDQNTIPPEELDPDSEEIRKIVEAELAYEDFEKAEKMAKFNEWGIEESPEEQEQE